MRYLRKLTALGLTALLFFAMATVFSQMPAETENSDPSRTVRTILLITSYPVADVVTSNFFDSFRKGIRELNLPIDCHVVELNATIKDREDRFDSTFGRLAAQINNGVYSAIVTLNHEAADLIMRHYDDLSRDIPVMFVGLGRVPDDLKRRYPNSSAIGIPDDTSGTIELALKLFPEAQNLALVVDDTTISEETRNEILSKCKLHFPQLDYLWLNAEMDKHVLQNKLAGFPDETLILFFPSHDYANGHDETLTAFVQNIGFDRRFPCLALDDTLIGNGVVGGSMIETHKLGREAARMAAQILNAGSAQRIQERIVTPRKIVDYSKFRTYDAFSGRIPLGATVVNKPETMWTRHWQTFVLIICVAIAFIVVQIFYFAWIRHRLRMNRNMLYSLPGRVMVLNRAETILFASWIRENPREKFAPAKKKLENLIGIDYPKLSQTIHEVFQTGRQTTIEYNYEDVHRAISFATLEHDIFGQDAVICFSLDNTELQNARKEAEKYSAQLKKNTRMWDILINFLPIHIFAKDIDDDFRYVFNNRTRCKFYGLGENEINSKTDFDFLPRELAEQRRKEDEAFVANPESDQIECNVDVRSWNGKVQHLRSIQRIFTDEDGTRLLLGTSINITELEEARIQMQQLNGRLQELLEQHSVLLDNMPSFVITKDVDDGFRIITCNEACLNFIDLPLSDVVGKTDSDLLHFREDAEAVHADDLRALEILERRPEYHSTGRLHDRNGRIRIGNFYRKLIRTADNHRILFTLFHDVTDLENAKREAEANADRFLLTLRSIGDGVITTDSHGLITMINPNAEALLGCKQADVLGKPHTDFFRVVHEQTEKPVTSPLTDALRTGIVTEGADLTDLISSSGQRYHIAASASPIHTRSGEITGAILVFRDVTDERNKREELRRTMTELESASEIARLASFRYDFKTGKRTGSNRLLNELWPEDENGNALLEEQWVHPDDLPVFKQNMKNLLEKNAPNEAVQFSFRVGQSDDLRYYRMKVILDRKDPNGAAVTGIVQDVTEITMNMMKLRDAQALWDVAINAIPIMFTVKDIDNDFRYLLCNKAFSTVFNLSPEEIVGKRDREVFHDETILGFADQINSHMTDADSLNTIEGELEDGEGHHRYIKTIMRVFKDASGRRLLLSAASDVTDMHRLLTIERIGTEMLSQFNREPGLAQLMDNIVGIIRRELGCSRIVIVRMDKDKYSAFHQWQYDGLHEIKDPERVLVKLGWEKRVRESEKESDIIRIDDIPSVAHSLGLNQDKGAGKLEFSLVSIPIYENKQLIGGIFLSFLEDRRDFADFDAAVLNGCAGIVGLARQRERSQQAVRQALIENQMVLDNIDIPIWLFNTNNELVRTNAAVSRIAGRPYTILDPVDNDRIFRDFSANIKESEFEDAEHRGSSKRQSTTYRNHDYIIATESVRDNRGNPLYNMKYAVDVTNLNHLIQNQKFVNELLEDIISEDDFDNCIRSMLENVCKLIGASRGCLLHHEQDGTMAHCVAEYVEPKHAHSGFTMLHRTLSRVTGILENTPDKRTFVCNNIYTIDWQLVREDWHQAAIAIDLRAIFLSNILCTGEIWGTVAFNFEGVSHMFSENDITLLRATAHMIELVLSRKRAKSLIMDALERAQAADKAKSFFIASVSHEIRTPLNSVIGFAELLREGGVSQKQEKEYLDAISSSANALLMLINDVLDLSKLEANQMQIITAFTDFKSLCREVLLIFTFRAQENGNKLVSDVPDDLPELDVDNIRIRQILINLLGNAVKFTKKGTITLAVSFTPDSGSADTGTLRCAVSDTGIGISEDDQKKLMEPFVQLSRMRGTNAVNNGTGLGLSISKRLAVCMNGELTCTSSLGEGSTFGITLNGVRYRQPVLKPATKAKKAQLPSESGQDASRDLSKIRILVVDDVPMNLRVAKAIFAKIGYKNVFTAGSGKDALDLLEKQPIDLMLSDMWMPEMNGAQLSAAVKKNPKFSHIPIVAQTADVETSGNFDMSHFDAIILKPITGEKLANMVRRVMGDDDGSGVAGQDGSGPINLG